METMSFRRTKQNDALDIWPGFVDALATVLLVFIFVLVGFISSQMYLSRMVVDKNSSLSSLEIELLSSQNLLNKEKIKSSDFAKQISELQNSINHLNAMISEETDSKVIAQKTTLSLQDQIKILTDEINGIRNALLNQQKISADQMQTLEAVQSENLKLSDFKKINSYKSEFFSKMQDIVMDKQNIKIVGDRFVFQSELFFNTASADLSVNGKRQIAELGMVIKDIAKKIPSNIKWVLRVDGHTDSRNMIGGRGKFFSNWELSLARSMSVVRQLMINGVPPVHLVAAGFGQHQPISRGQTEEDFSKNRRIEFRLDSN